MLKRKKENPKKEEKKIKKIHLFGWMILLLSIIRKNIKLILRSKSSSLIVLLGPLLIIALVGTAYNTSNIYDIRIGAYSASYSELAESLLTELGSKQFSVIKLNSAEECIASLKSAEIHVCALIPKDLTTETSDTIDFQVDQSRVNLVWIVIDAISSKVSTKKTELSLQLTSSILDTITNSLGRLQENEKMLSSLQQSTSQVESGVESVSSALNALEFDLVGQIELGNVGQKLDEVVSANNLSSALFDPVRATITKIKNNTEGLEKTLEQSKTDALSGLGETQTLLSGSSDSLLSVLASVRDIKSNIELATGASAESIVTPIKTKITPVVAEKTHLSFLFPTLLVLVIMLMALILSSSLIIREKTNPALFRNSIAPVKDSMFVLAHFLTNLSILVLQIGVVMAVAAFFFKETLFVLLWKIAIALLPITGVFILIGMFIGYLFKSEETSMLGTISAASIFLFFSSTILPLETLPQSLKRIADFNPFVISESILKKIMLFKVDIGLIFEPLIILVTYMIILAAFVYIAQRYSKTRG